MGMYKKIMLAITSMVAFVLFVVAIGMIQYSSNQAEKELKQKVKLLVNSLAVSTTTFVWELNGAPLEVVIDNYTEDKDISYIKVFDASGNLFSKERPLDDRDKKKDLYVASEISFEGKVIGKVILGYNQKRIHQNISDSMFWISAIMVCFFIILIVAIHYILKSVIKPLIVVSSKLSNTAMGLNSSADELSNSGGILADSVRTQSASLEESSASLEELTGMVNNNLSNAKESSVQAESVTQSSKRGNEAMGELVRSMQGITESNENIQKLSSILAEIANKTQVIDEIVFQTKLLSFNASVEAERAGEHGRGFAVVAQEVGNLAQMSGKAASEISSIIKESITSAESITKDNK